MLSQQNVSKLASLSRDSLIGLAKQFVPNHEADKIVVTRYVDTCGYDSDKQQTTNTNKKDSMSDLLKNIPGLNISFGQVEKGKLALSMSGEVAFRDKQGNYVIVNTNEAGEKQKVHVGSLKFDVPFYTLPTQTLVKGDIVILDGDVLIVGENTKGDTKFINPITGATTTRLQQTNILNMFFYTKVVSMFNIAGGDGAQGIGLAGLNPMALMLLSGDGGFGGGGSDIGELLVMSQLAGANGGAGLQGILPLLLMSKSGSGDGLGSLLPFLLMSQGGAAGAGANPLASLFGGLVAPAAIPTKKAASKRAAKTKTPVVAIEKATPRKAAKKANKARKAA